MQVMLSKMPTDGLPFQHQYKEQELDLSGHEFSFLQLPSVNGRVNKIGMEMRVKGVLTAQLEVTCDRCLKTAEFPVNNNFDLFYLPAEANTNQAGEVELQEHELDFSFYQDEKIDIDELVLEQFELSLPQRILCQTDCLGLCSQCGTNLNDESCDCQSEIDPRWQALADLKS